ncbi:hypothetical protein [Adhaeribacter radiodurans]|uniref:Uncharacterized protein n=1 Tax=Adhaeribacter radiodurans TaxID=2745197 RepID=A0A7L7L3P2_9BACT|nr:hypothetical protein [Adhaeribacter radiodurans]QMU27394.1 hypothetical protein HUW48_04790 [Adhaeribacter radiodurans]
MLSAENAKRINDYLGENLDKKVRYNFLSIEGMIGSLKVNIHSIKIELLKISILVTDLVSFTKLEIFNLLKWLHKTLSFYEKYVSKDYDVKTALEAIATYIKKDKYLSNSEKDHLIDAIRKINDLEFKRYVDEIKEFLKIQK